MQLTTPEISAEKKAGRESTHELTSSVLKTENRSRKRLRTRGSHRRRHSLRRRRQVASKTLPTPVVAFRHHDFYFNVSDDEGVPNENLDDLPANDTSSSDADRDDDSIYSAIVEKPAETVARRLKRFLSGEISSIGQKLTTLASAFAKKKAASKKKANLPKSTFFVDSGSSCGYSSARDLDTTFYSTLREEKAIRKPQEISEKKAESDSLYSTISSKVSGEKLKEGKAKRKQNRKAEKEDKISKVDLVNRTVTVERRPRRRGLTRRTSRCACVLRF